MEDKKFFSVILAALLHDIGKAVQGSNHVFAVSREYYGHPGISARLIESLFKEKILDESFFDKELTVMLAGNHHDRDIKESEKIIGENLSLAALISVADSYSSRERESINKEKMGKGNQRLKTLMPSVFSMVENSGTKAYYKVGPLREGDVCGNTLPVDTEDNTGITESYDLILKGFIESIKKIKSKNAFDYLASVQGALEEFFWAVPSVTITDTNDICLYDHLKVSAAVAASLYSYHLQSSTLNDEKAVRNENEEKFRFVAGDITGIQDFIFDINTLNAKGLSKELRGRSFLVSLIGSIISLKILNRLNLPVACKIVDAGGKFVLMVPNTKNTIEVLESVYSEVTSETIEVFGGNLLPVIDWSVSISADSFNDMKKVIKKIEKSISDAKLHKLSCQNVYHKCYRMEKEYNNFVNFGKCPSCGVRPAFEENGKVYDCNICNIAKEIGGKIASSEIAFINYKECESGFDFTDKGFMIYGIQVSFDNVKDKESFYSERIRKSVKEDVFVPFRDISNHVPVSYGKIDVDTFDGNFKEGTLCYYCQDPCDNIDERKSINGAGLLTFQCISAATPLKNMGSSTAHLAVLKGDVDDLGYIFSEGLGDKLSLSRYVSLSRMMNLFFSLYLKNFLKRKYPYIYTVYAGGDDFVLIGPWEETMEAAVVIRDEFKKFTGGNPYINFSAGISLFKPRQPVLAAVNEADNMLENAKARPGKNGICIFGSAISWEEIKGDVNDIKNILSEFVEKSHLSMSGVYRILNYYRMYEEYKKTGHVEFLKYEYLMSYDIKRNYKDNELLMKTLFELKDENKMSILKIPLHWVIYKKRNKKGGGNA